MENFFFLKKLMEKSWNFFPYIEKGSIDYHWFSLDYVWLDGSLTVSLISSFIDVKNQTFN